MQTLVYTLDLFGCAVFAATAAIVAARKGMDLFGVVTLGLATAIGGGTLRDMALGMTPVFWVRDTAYVWAPAVAAVVCFIVLRYRGLPERALLVADAFGLAVFSANGAQKALDACGSPLIALVMGVMTGCAGGMIRDVLCAEAPLILKREIYATAALAGAVVYVALRRAGAPDAACMLLGGLATLALRLAAIRWRLALPTARHPDGV